MPFRYMKFYQFAAVFVCCLSQSGWAQSQQEDPNAATDVVLKIIDASQVVKIQNGGCEVTITTDKDALIQDVDRLRTIGFLNNSFSDQYFESNPATLILIGSLQASAAAAQGFFQGNASPDLCHFKQYLSYADSYGNTQTDLLFSFNFDRATYNKINWDKFSASNMSKVSKHFVTTPTMEAMEQIVVQSENSSN